MKRILFILALIVSAATITAQTSESSVAEYSQDPKANFRLYKTQNMYTFLKLDTRNGQMETVQWGVTGERRTYLLSNQKLVSAPEQEIPGRFTLHATTNPYQFILIDQIDGRVWQVQWGTDKAFRGVIEIPFDEEIDDEPAPAKIEPKIAEVTMLKSLNLAPAFNEQQQRVTQRMATIQKKYKELNLSRSPINEAYMIVARQLMTSPYREDWKFVEQLNELLNTLLKEDCTIDKAKLESELEGLTDYVEIAKIFNNYFQLQ